MKVFSKLMMTIATVLFTSQVFAAPARILIIRHGEKPVDKTDIHLSPRGFQRAQALTGLFTQQPQLLTYGRPAAIFAFNNFGDGSERGIETSTPLATTLGLPLNTNFRPDETQQIASFIFQTATLTGKMVMIVWRHSNIQDLATALRVQNAPAWDKNVFDRIWEINYSPQGQVVSFKDLPQHLLPGDSN